MAIRFVLASASPARLRVLRAAGLAPEVIVSGVDEDAFDEPSAAGLVAALAEAKAWAVSSSLDGPRLVLGCDSMLVAGLGTADERVMGKPKTPERAVERWRQLRGTHACLLTGHCLIRDGGTPIVRVATTDVHFGAPTDDEIVAYVNTGEPLEVAGGFTIDGRASAFIDGIAGDHGNVIGVSMPLLRHMLAEAGLRLTDLWVSA